MGHRCGKPVFEGTSRLRLPVHMRRQTRQSRPKCWVFEHLGTSLFPFSIRLRSVKPVKPAKPVKPVKVVQSIGFLHISRTPKTHRRDPSNPSNPSNPSFCKSLGFLSISRPQISFDVTFKPAQTTTTIEVVKSRVFFNISCQYVAGKYNWSSYNSGRQFLSCSLCMLF